MRKYACLTILFLALPAFGQDLFPNQAAQQAMQQAQQDAAMQSVWQQSQQVVTATCSPVRLQAPKFSIKPGTYSAPQRVKIIDLYRLATIHYTTDGSIPTEASPKFTIHHRPIPIDSTTRLQAIAVSCEIHSPVASALYTLAAQPTPPAPQATSATTPQKPGS
jgi:hypothetical protein